MAPRPVTVVVNGVTGRMGYRQHLVPSLLAIREQGGLLTSDGDHIWPEPVLVGRPAGRERARRPGDHRLGQHSGVGAGGRLVAGVGTDQLPLAASTLADVVTAYTEQLADVVASGATPVLICSRQLAAATRDADDYLNIYSGLVGQCTGPVVLHWLGEMFDPALSGYWGR